MSSPGPTRNPIERLAEEFLARYRKGERPSPDEYAEKYPELAAEIREVFPALVLMEEAGPGPATDNGPAGAPAGGAAPGRLGDYRILREVGRGGMGVVYEAVQESLGRHVALKVLPRQDAADPTRLGRFRREARSAARLHHSNIVPVYEVGESGGTRYYAMQFIRGQGLDQVLAELRRLREGAVAAGPGPTVQLADVLRTGPVAAAGAGEGEPPSDGPTPPAGPGTAPLPEGLSVPSSQAGSPYFRSVARLGAQAAEALAYAHGQGVLHRDVKPANLLLDATGNVWLTDFGLAKEEGGDALTRTGDVLGTFRYMAPERFNGVSDKLGDVYALGATLYELLTLRPAFEETDRGRLVRRVMHEEPPRPRALDRHVPRDLETVVLKAMAKEPRRRYQTAQELADDLGRFLADRPIRARRTSAAEHAWRWGRRNPGLATAVAAIALLLIGGAGGGWWLTWQRTEALTDSQERLWAAHLARARAGHRAGVPGRRLDSLAAVAQALALPVPRDRSRDELRNVAIACLALTDVQVSREWDGWPADSVGLDFDSTLTHYVRTDRQGTAYLARTADGATVLQFPSGLAAPQPRLSDDGQFLALHSPPHLKVWRLAGAGREVVLDEPSCRSFELGPGRLCAVTHDPRSVSVYDLRARKCLRRLTWPRGHFCVKVAPDDRQLAVAGDRTLVYDAETGAVLADLPCGMATDLAWRPDGKALAVKTAGATSISVWDLSSRRRLNNLDEGDEDTRIVFSRGGNLLAGQSRQAGLRLWDARTGRLLFHAQQAWQGPLRFGPDDRSLAGDVKGTRIRLWAVAVGRSHRALGRVPGQLSPGCAFSPDGRLLAAGCKLGIGLWDLRTGAAHYAPFKLVSDVAFDSSGRLLTQGHMGLCRWPALGDGAEIRLGPPQRLVWTGGAPLACSADGRVAAVTQAWGAEVLDAGQPGRTFRVGPHDGTCCVAVSPDGARVATVSLDAAGVRVWGAQTRQLEKELPAGPGPRVGFSPDGRWLATTGGGGRLWQVGSWAPGRELGGDVFAFSPDGRLLAVETGDGVIRLLAPDSDREYARLESPDREPARGLAFSPDGATLAAVGPADGFRPFVWDLRQLRAELKGMGLDWGLPEYPPRPPPAAEVAGVRVDHGALRSQLRPAHARVMPNLVELMKEPHPALAGVRVDLGDLLAELHQPEARALYAVAAALQPLNAQAQYRLALAARTQGFPAVKDLTPAYRAWYGGAADACTRALAIDPGHVEAYRVRAWHRRVLGEWDKALADLSAAIRLRPTDAAAYEERARLYRRLGDHGRELADLQALVDLDPNNPKRCGELAWALVAGPPALRDPARALPLAERITAWGHRSEGRGALLDAYRACGVVYFRVGRFAEARACFEANLQVRHPLYRGTDLFFLAMCHQRLNDAARARQYFDQGAAALDEEKKKRKGETPEEDALQEEARAALALPRQPRGRAPAPREVPQQG
jgi:serine/threonine protein kinase/WD40 repeat protein/tetratricopeptide (TPR) repeat protein